MLVSLRVLVVAGLALLTAPSLGITQPTSSATRSERAPASGGPRVESTATAVRRVTQVSETNAQRRRAQSAGKPAALMIVGGAAVILGAIIGDTVGVLFMVGGAVAFLYGLYLYLQ